MVNAFFVLPPMSAMMYGGVAQFMWTAEFCTTPLLASPLASQRQARAAAALELASLPLAAVQPVAAALLPAHILLEGAGGIQLPQGSASLLPLACSPQQNCCFGVHTFFLPCPQGMPQLVCSAKRSPLGCM